MQWIETTSSLKRAEGMIPQYNGVKEKEKISGREGLLVTLTALVWKKARDPR